MVIHPHNTNDCKPIRHTRQTTPEPPPKAPCYTRVFCIPMTTRGHDRSTARCANSVSDLRPPGHGYPSAQRRRLQADSSHATNLPRATSQSTVLHAGLLHTNDYPRPRPEYRPLCQLGVGPPAVGAWPSTHTTPTIASRF